MVGGSFEGGEEVEELGLLALLEAFQIHDLLEVGVGFIRNVDEVGLDEGLRWGGADLESLEQRVDACHGLIDALHEAAESQCLSESKGCGWLTWLVEQCRPPH